MTTLASQSGQFALGGTTTVNRLGYGAMQLTGPGVWGDPADPDEAIRVLRRAVDQGVNLIDTADSYGPHVSEELIRRALHPYPEGLVIATKAGFARGGPDDWRPLGRPEYLRQQALMSLRRLGLERIELFQLHRIDHKVRLDDQIGELRRLQDEGKIGHIGLSEVRVRDLKKAQKLASIVSVQNRFNVTDRSAEDVLRHCEERGIAFIPWHPLGTGGLTGSRSPLAGQAAELGVTSGQLALAWLLRRSPVMLPIPGTSSTSHLDENLAAAQISLTDAQFEAISHAAR